MSDSEDPIDLPDEGGDDLFGDDDDNDVQSEQERVLSDRDLESDRDDDDQPARTAAYDDDDGAMDDQVVQQKTIMNIDMYRHKIPKTKDHLVSQGITLKEMWAVLVDHPCSYTQ
jgi:RNA polymerase-associated protein LEO1